jgi:energy-converting hydrogenase Eha subunit H
MEFSTIVLVVIVAAVAYTLFKAFSKKETVEESAPYKVETPAPVVEAEEKKPTVKKATTRKPKAPVAKKPSAKKTTAKSKKA